MEKETIIINLVGGPGVGKSTLANLLTAEFAMNSKYQTELVTEYAKDLVWLEAKIFDELSIFAKQHMKILKVNGKVDIIITDAPLLLKLHYMDPGYNFSSIVVNTIDRYNNIFLFLERDEESKFQETGRIHNLEQSIEIDNKLKNILNEYGYEYTSINSYKQDVKELKDIIENLIEEKLENLKDPKYIKKEKSLSEQREVKALLNTINEVTIKDIKKLE